MRSFTASVALPLPITLFQSSTSCRCLRDDRARQMRIQLVLSLLYPLGR